MITLTKEDAFTIVDIISKAQEIVRCTDCKYWDETYFYHGEDDAMQRCICRKHNNIFMTADDFCSRGERR